MPQHNCTENRCRGQRFYGAKLKCTKCSDSTFIECLMSRAEIVELVKYLSFITPEKTNDQEKKMKTLFGRNSVLSFVCVKCREDDTNATLIDENTQLKSEKESLAVELSTLKDTNAQLHQTIEDLKQQIQSSSDDDTVDENVNVNVSMLKKELQKFGGDLLCKMRKEMKSMHQNGSQTRTPQSNNNNTHVQFETLLPPQQSKPKKSVYEMHVSKFRPGTMVEAIKRKIIEKTDLNEESFNVEKLVGSHDNEYRMGYVSFKIVTLNHDAYESIMDQSVWGNDFAIRDFEQTKANTHNRTVERKKYTNDPMHAQYNNRYTTPKKPMKWTPNQYENKQRQYNNKPKWDKHTPKRTTNGRYNSNSYGNTNKSNRQWDPSSSQTSQIPSNAPIYVVPANPNFMMAAPPIHPNIQPTYQQPNQHQQQQQLQQT